MDGGELADPMDPKSHQPSGLWWFRVFSLYLPIPSSLGEGFTPPPTPSPGVLTSGFATR